MSNQPKKLKANKVQTQAVKDIIKEFPKLGIPTEISIGNKDCYVLACVKKSIDANGTTTATMQLVVKDQNSWEAMQSHSNKAFNCNIVLIIHNPNIAEEEKKEDKVLSLGQVERVKAMQLEGLDLKAIAKTLKAPQYAVEPHMTVEADSDNGGDADNDTPNE